MTIVNPPVPVPGPRGTEETNAASAINALLTDYNGNITDANLSAIAAIASGKLADAAKLGLTDGGTIRRGKSIIATSEARANVAYGLMPTPDRVSGIVLPADGLIVVGYQATWQESVAGAANANIFLGANEVSGAFAETGTAPLHQGARLGYAAVDMPLASSSIGLVSGQSKAAPVGYTGDVTTGQVLGSLHSLSLGGIGSEFVVVNAGPCHIFAAAGTYDVSVQFKATSGSVTVKNRKLWVWTIGF